VLRPHLEDGVALVDAAAAAGIPTRTRLAIGWRAFGPPGCLPGHRQAVRLAGERGWPPPSYGTVRSIVVALDPGSWRSRTTVRRATATVSSWSFVTEHPILTCHRGRDSVDAIQPGLAAGGCARRAAREHHRGASEQHIGEQPHHPDHRDCARRRSGRARDQP
jgi:hypothetical protein